MSKSERSTEMNKGKELQAEYTRKLRAAGHVLAPLSGSELKIWRSGADMPDFRHICMDGDVVVGERS
jgi:hypothetical protein